MTLSAGARLGPYEVVGLVGAGGMGEVYRAHDPRLGRDVAVKVLPAEVASSPERLSRFEREARAVAALSHPNILSVFDVGTSPVPYVVTELLEGETLRQTARHRAPSPRQVLSLAVQIARGLEAAHAKGIVHRDVKPENVFVTSDGRVKLLDFGLALAAERTTSAGPGAPSAWRTETGAMLGTAGYMSPEQVRGLPVDARTDIFSFGVVLYELLGGRPPFQRATKISTLAATLDDEPPELVTIGRGVPPALSGIVKRCLEKERAERFGSARDLGFALEAVAAAPAGAAALRELEECSPYPGLASFTEKDAGEFFGREHEVKALWERLRERALSGVIGPSGAGKTSFVRAGVVASRPDDWAALVCTPGAAPFRGLGQALLATFAGDLEALERILSLDEASAFDLVRRWRRGSAEALLVVDQFEELFTLCPDDVQRRFAALLGRLARDGDVHVLLSVRDDFLMRCAEHEPLAQVFESLCPLPALSENGLRRALVEPARARGCRFEDEALVDEMLASVAGTRGALPLLAFAVSRLWEKRDRETRLLTRAAYEEIGGVAGALAQHAEEAMDRIGATREPLVRELFRNLVTAHGTRAVADREELLSAFPLRAEADAVLRALIDARLVTSYEIDADPGQAGRHRVEVVHESLLQAWPRLVRWQVQDEEGAVLRDQLRQAAHLWREKGRTGDLLWTGTAYREFELWRERYPGALTALEEDFSRAMRERALRRRRLARAAAGAVVLASTAVAVAIGLSRHQAVLARERAEREARHALASRLLALGELAIDRYPTAALAYTTRSLEIEDTAEARRQALRILWTGPPARVLAVPEGNQALNLAFSPDGRSLAATGFVPPNVLLFADDGRLTRTFTQPRAKARPSVSIPAFGGDALFRWCGGDVLAWALDGGPLPPLDGPKTQIIGTKDGLASIAPRPAGRPGARLQLWSVSQGAIRLERSVPLAPDEWPDPTLTRLFRRAGSSLFTRRLPGEGAPAPAVLVGRQPTAISDFKSSPGGRRVVTFDAAGDWRAWSTEEGRVLAVRKPPPRHTYSTASFDPKGDRIAWSSSEGPGTYVWDLADPPDAHLLALRAEPVGVSASPDVGIPVFDPAGRWLASTLAYDTILLWPVELPRSRQLSGFSQAPRIIRFTPDSRELVTCGRDGMRIFPLGPGEGGQRKVVLPGGEDFCYGMDVDPRGGRVGLATHSQGLFVVTLATGSVRRVLPPEAGTFFRGCAFDPTGRRLATNRVRMEDRSVHVIRDADLATGEVRTWEYRDPRVEGLEAVPLAFARDGRLVLGGYDRVVAWTPGQPAPATLFDLRGALAIQATPDGRWLTVLDVLSDPADPHAGEVVILDLETGMRRLVTGHGSAVSAAALDSTGRILVTADAAGDVRVGPSSGAPPQLLPGHRARPNCVAVSPDGRWIASAAGTDLRLWPMPDLSRPPLHTLPHDELLARLRALTNLRVVDDERSTTGYALEVGPFPGWRDVPTW